LLNKVFYLAEYITAVTLDVLSAHKFGKALSGIQSMTQPRRIHGHLQDARRNIDPKLSTQKQTLFKTLMDVCANRMVKPMDVSKVPLPHASQLYRPWIHHELMPILLQHLGSKLGVQFENRLECPKCRKALPLTSASERNNFLCSGMFCQSKAGVPVLLVR
jgi:hypothetical protein